MRLFWGFIMLRKHEKARKKLHQLVGCNPDILITGSQCIMIDNYVDKNIIDSLKICVFAARGTFIKKKKKSQTEKHIYVQDNFSSSVS